MSFDIEFSETFHKRLNIIDVDVSVLKARLAIVYVQYRSVVYIYAWIALFII